MASRALKKEGLQIWSFIPFRTSLKYSVSPVSYKEKRKKNLLHLRNERTFQIGAVEVAKWNRSIFERDRREQVIRVSKVSEYVFEVVM